MSKILDIDGRMHDIKNFRQKVAMWTNSYTLAQTGEFIADARRESGFTQAQFAERLGVSHGTLSSLEQGRGVSSETLQKAIQMLDMRFVIVPKTATITVDEASPRGGRAS